MKDIKVKICGVKDIQTALEAESSGADYIGLVFCKKSKRCISINRAKEIISALKPSTSLVALFSNDEEKYIKSVMDEINVDIIQFHGDEKDSDCIKYGLQYIKGISEANNGFKDLDKRYPNALAFIADSHQDDGMGGTGKTFDWENNVFDTVKPILIAGGLNCDNVEDAIRLFLPYGVDVSSGVESSDGNKDLSLIKEFIKKAKNENK
jgi:phosphoribosylanthranilate isomerase